MGERTGGKKSKATEDVTRKSDSQSSSKSKKSSRVEDDRGIAPVSTSYSSTQAAFPNTAGASVGFSDATAYSNGYEASSTPGLVNQSSTKMSSTSRGDKDGEKRSKSGRDRKGSKSKSIDGGSRAEPADQVSSHVPDQFPGQFPSEVAEPYRPPLAANEGGPGLAADYYGDTGESVADQPGYRKQSPSLIIGAEPHLQAASAVAAPPPEPSSVGGVGAAASFYSGSFEDETGSNASYHASTYVSATSKPAQTSTSSLPAIGGAAMGAAAGYIGSQHGDSVSETTYVSRPPQSQESGPSKTSKPSNVPLYAAGAAGAAGLAATALHNSHSHSHTHESSTPMARRRRSGGPFNSLVNFFRDPEGVAQYEEYTEFIGVCRNCFDPESTPRDAPRKHHYRRKRSDERIGRTSRVEKSNRYSSEEERDKSWLATGLAGYGLGKMGETLLKQTKDFDDTYSIKSGRYSPEARRRKSDSRRKSEDVQIGIADQVTGSKRRRSRSRSRERKTSGTIIGITASPERYHRSHSRSPERRRKSKGKKKDKGFFGFLSPSSSSSSLDIKRKSKSKDKDEKKAEAALVGLGAAAAALAAADGRTKKKDVKNLVGVKETKPQYPPPTAEEAAWEDESDSVDSGLAFGAESPASDTSEKKLDRRRRSEMSGKGSIPRRRSWERDSVITAVDPPRKASPPLQRVFPVPTSDPGRYDVDRDRPLMASRSEDVPLQQPKPVTPVSKKVYATQSPEERPERKLRRRGTSPARFGIDKDAEEFSFREKASSKDDSSVRFDLPTYEPERRERRKRKSEGSREDIPSRKDSLPEEKEHSRKDASRSNESQSSSWVPAAVGLAGAAVGAAALMEGRDAETKEERRERRRREKRREEEADDARRRRRKKERADSPEDDKREAYTDRPGEQVEQEDDTRRRRRRRERDSPEDDRRKVNTLPMDQVRENQDQEVRESRISWGELPKPETSSESRDQSVWKEMASTKPTYENYQSFFTPVELLNRSDEVKVTSENADADIEFERASIVTVAPKRSRDRSASPDFAAEDKHNGQIDPSKFRFPWIVPRLRLLYPTPPETRESTPVIRPRGSNDDDIREVSDVTDSHRSTEVPEIEEVDEDIPKIEKKPLSIDAEPNEHDKGEEDYDFAAAVAASAEEAGFDPSIIINNPNFHRRESPPNSKDRDMPEESDEEPRRRKSKRKDKEVDIEPTLIEDVEEPVSRDSKKGKKGKKKSKKDKDVEIPDSQGNETRDARQDVDSSIDTSTGEVPAVMSTNEDQKPKSKAKKGSLWDRILTRPGASSQTNGDVPETKEAKVEELEQKQPAVPPAGSVTKYLADDSDEQNEQTPESFLGERPDPPPPPDIGERQINESAEASPSTPRRPSEFRIIDSPQSPKSVSSPTAVPVLFRRPGAPRGSSSRSMSQTPASPKQNTEDPPVRPKPRPRSTEFKSSTEFRPLWLVERHRSQQEPSPEETYPSLPSSHTSSRSSSPHQTHLIHDQDAGVESLVDDGRGQDHSRQEPEYLDSEQATPTVATFSQSAAKDVPTRSGHQDLSDSAPVDSTQPKEASIKPKAQSLERSMHSDGQDSTLASDQPNKLEDIHKNPSESHTLQNVAIGAAVGASAAYALHSLGSKEDLQDAEDNQASRDSDKERSGEPFDQSQDPTMSDPENFEWKPTKKGKKGKKGKKSVLVPIDDDELSREVSTLGETSKQASQPEDITKDMSSDQVISAMVASAQDPNLESGPPPDAEPLTEEFPETRKGKSKKKKSKKALAVDDNTGPVQSAEVISSQEASVEQPDEGQPPQKPESGRAIAAIDQETAPPLVSPRDSPLSTPLPKEDDLEFADLRELTDQGDSSTHPVDVKTPAGDKSRIETGVEPKLDVQDAEKTQLSTSTSAAHQDSTQNFSQDAKEAIPKLEPDSIDSTVRELGPDREHNTAVETSTERSPTLTQTQVRPGQDDLVKDIEEPDRSIDHITQESEMPKEGKETALTSTPDPDDPGESLAAETVEDQDFIESLPKKKKGKKGKKIEDDADRLDVDPEAAAASATPSPNPEPEQSLQEADAFEEYPVKSKKDKKKKKKKGEDLEPVEPEPRELPSTLDENSQAREPSQQDDVFEDFPVKSKKDKKKKRKGEDLSTVDPEVTESADLVDEESKEPLQDVDTWEESPVKSKKDKKKKKKVEDLSAGDTELTEPLDPIDEQSEQPTQDVDAFEEFSVKSKKDKKKKKKGLISLDAETSQPSDAPIVDETSREPAQQDDIFDGFPEYKKYKEEEVKADTTNPLVASIVEASQEPKQRDEAFEESSKPKEVKEEDLIPLEEKNTEPLDASNAIPEASEPSLDDAFEEFSKSKKDKKKKKKKGMDREMPRVDEAALEDPQDVMERDPTAKTDEESTRSLDVPAPRSSPFEDLQAQDQSQDQEPAPEIEDLPVKTSKKDKKKGKKAKFLAFEDEALPDAESTTPASEPLEIENTEKMPEDETQLVAAPSITDDQPRELEDVEDVLDDNKNDPEPEEEFPVWGKSKKDKKKSKKAKALDLEEPTPTPEDTTQDKPRELEDAQDIPEDKKRDPEADEEFPVFVKSKKDKKKAKEAKAIDLEEPTATPEDAQQESLAPVPTESARDISVDDSAGAVETPLDDDALLPEEAFSVKGKKGKKKNKKSKPLAWEEEPDEPGDPALEKPDTEELSKTENTYPTPEAAPNIQESVDSGSNQQPVEPEATVNVPREGERETRNPAEILSNDTIALAALNAEPFAKASRGRSPDPNVDYGSSEAAPDRGLDASTPGLDPVKLQNKDDISDPTVDSQDISEPTESGRTPDLADASADAIESETPAAFKSGKSRKEKKKAKKKAQTLAWDEPVQEKLRGPSQERDNPFDEVFTKEGRPQDESTSGLRDEEVTVQGSIRDTMHENDSRRETQAETEAVNDSVRNEIPESVRDVHEKPGSVEIAADTIETPGQELKKEFFQPERTPPSEPEVSPVRGPQDIPVGLTFDDIVEPSEVTEPSAPDQKQEAVSFPSEMPRDLTQEAIPAEEDEIVAASKKAKKKDKKAKKARSAQEQDSNDMGPEFQEDVLIVEGHYAHKADRSEMTDPNSIDRDKPSRKSVHIAAGSPEIINTPEPGEASPSKKNSGEPTPIDTPVSTGSIEMLDAEEQREYEEQYRKELERQLNPQVHEGAPESPKDPEKEIVTEPQQADQDADKLVDADRDAEIRDFPKSEPQTAESDESELFTVKSKKGKKKRSKKKDTIIWEDETATEGIDQDVEGVPDQSFERDVQQDMDRPISPEGDDFRGRDERSENLENPERAPSRGRSSPFDGIAAAAAGAVGAGVVAAEVSHRGSKKKDKRKKPDRTAESDESPVRAEEPPPEQDHQRMPGQFDSTPASPVMTNARDMDLPEPPRFDDIPVQHPPAEVDPTPEPHRHDNAANRDSAIHVADSPLIEESMHPRRAERDSGYPETEDADPESEIIDSYDKSRQMEMDPAQDEEDIIDSYDAKPDDIRSDVEHRDLPSDVPRKSKRKVRRRMSDPEYDSDDSDDSGYDKQRRRRRAMVEEAREPSPVDSTTKDRSSALFDSSPSARQIEKPTEAAASREGDSPSGFDDCKHHDSIFGGPTRDESESPLSDESRRRHRLAKISENSLEGSPLDRKSRSKVKDHPQISEERSPVSPLPPIKDQRHISDEGHSHSRRLSNQSNPSVREEWRRQAVGSPDSIHAIIRTPELRSSSGQSIRSSGTPPLRRVDRSASSDLRGASKIDEAKARAKIEAEPELPTPIIPSSSTYDPLVDKGKSRGDMADVYEGYGDVPGSPRSPTRPPSMRKRQSMQFADLEQRFEQLAAEHRSLQTAKSVADRRLEEQARDHSQQRETYEDAIQEHKTYLTVKEKELNKLHDILEGFKNQVAELRAVNEELQSSRGLHEDDPGRYSKLHSEHENTRTELADLRMQHARLQSTHTDTIEREIEAVREEKDDELRQLQNELEEAKAQIRSLQQQILASKSSDEYVERDEDYFENECKSLCHHVQQWVMRFSKFSDNRACRMLGDLEDPLSDMFDDAILDGTEADDLLQDRIKRRDVFMSVVMARIFEYIFARYLFGLDREHRKKLKELDQTLSEIGPQSAVQKWRSNTLSLLIKRPEYEQQREDDTEGVVNSILRTLAAVLPPKKDLIPQITDSLRRVVSSAVDLHIEMRLQRAEFQMLPPLKPEFDPDTGDIIHKVPFNATLMNERSGDVDSNESLQEDGAVVRMVLFPLVVKNGSSEDDEPVVVCPAQVLSSTPSGGRGSSTNPTTAQAAGKQVRVMSAIGERSEAGSWAGTEDENSRMTGQEESEIEGGMF